MVYADSHAHLPSVAGELGRPALDTVLAAYAEASLSAGSSAVDASAAAPPAAPILVDIGTEPGDFAARFALLGARSFLRYTLGVWPGREALADPAASLAGLAASLAEAGGRAAAVGEC
ncbi:MAG: hypothetical protein JNG85_03630, partial [Spirochaetaceae bacterium]|nr:hypothetical protein [Spirochaetaceae bacterium]